MYQIWKPICVTSRGTLSFSEKGNEHKLYSVQSLTNLFIGWFWKILQKKGRKKSRNRNIWKQSREEVAGIFRNSGINRQPSGVKIARIKEIMACIFSRISLKQPVSLVKCLLYVVCKSRALPQALPMNITSIARRLACSWLQFLITPNLCRAFSWVFVAVHCKSWSF